MCASAVLESRRRNGLCSSRVQTNSEDVSVFLSFPQTLDIAHRQTQFTDNRYPHRHPPEHREQHSTWVSLTPPGTRPDIQILTQSRLSSLCPWHHSASSTTSRLLTTLAFTEVLPSTILNSLQPEASQGQVQAEEGMSSLGTQGLCQPLSNS